MKNILLFSTNEKELKRIKTHLQIHLKNKFGSDQYKEIQATTSIKSFFNRLMQKPELVILSGKGEDVKKVSYPVIRLKNRVKRESPDSRVLIVNSSTYVV